LEKIIGNGGKASDMMTYIMVLQYYATGQTSDLNRVEEIYIKFCCIFTSLWQFYNAPIIVSTALFHGELQICQHRMCRLCLLYQNHVPFTTTGS